MMIASIALNLEVYDRNAFTEICPGKDQLYGYDKWWDALEYAKQVFGDYKVYCGLIWGIEPLQSSKDGMEEILSCKMKDEREVYLRVLWLQYGSKTSLQVSSPSNG